MNIAEAYDRYIDDCLVAKGRSRMTIRGLTFDRAIATRHFGEKELSEITIEDLTSFSRFLRATRCNNTVVRHMTYLRLVLRHYRSLGGECLSPDLVPVGRMEDTVAEYVTPAEVRRMVEACDKPDEKLIIALLFSSGVRVAELCEIKVADIYECSFRVKGKGNKVRVCFIDDRTRKLLDGYLSGRRDDNPYLFFTKWSKDHISTLTIGRIVNKAQKLAGINRHITPHAFRHGFATDLLNGGAAIQDVSDMLGHASIQTTMIYRHQTEAVLLQRYREAHTI